MVATVITAHATDEKQDAENTQKAKFKSGNIVLSSFPPVPDSKNFPPLVTHLVCHYIENLPEKPKTNKDLLIEYIRAYKNLEKAMSGASNSNDYEIKLIKE